jgi:hypothetical protein
MEMNSPKLYLMEIKEAREWLNQQPQDTSKIPSSLPEKLPAISFGSIFLEDVLLFLPKSLDSDRSFAYKNAELRLTSFFLDSSSLMKKKLLFSEHIDFIVPQAYYAINDSLYSLDARNLHVDFSDSLLTIDSLTLQPNYSEDAFASKFRYAHGMVSFACRNLNIQSINFITFLAGTSLAFRKCEVSSWIVDYYSDKRKPQDANPPHTIIPNEIVRLFPWALDVDSLLLHNGTIKMREREPESLQAGQVTIDHVNLAAYPVCLDSFSPHCNIPAQISVSGFFLGEAPFKASITYPIQHKALDLFIEASIGKFSLKKINSFLIPNERLELADGTLESGYVRMNIRNGVATTTVIPRYANLSMKVLNKNRKGKSGLIEGIKTFFANAFVLRSNNLDKNGRRAISATTTHSWSKKEEFLEFLWLSFRKSLGKVIGGFE